MDNNQDPVLIPAVLMSDGVVREQGTGKLTLVGMFTSWFSQGFPYKTPKFWITVSVTNYRNITEVTVVIRIEQKASGLVIASAAAAIKFPKPPEPNVIFEIPFPIDSVTFPQPGDYRIAVLSNDEKIGERVFAVVLRPPVVKPTLPPDNK